MIFKLLDKFLHRKRMRVVREVMEDGPSPAVAYEYLMAGLINANQYWEIMNYIEGQE